MRKKLLSILLTAALIMSLLPTAFAASTSGGYTVTVTKTNIKADGVVNYSGYGSLYIGDELSYLDSRGTELPQAALVDSQGNFIYPYKDTFNHYRYFDGIVTLCSGSSTNSYLYSPVEYYRMGETTPFATTWLGGPMIDGVAFYTEEVLVGTPDIYTEHAYLIGSDGQKLYEFPDRFDLYDYSVINESRVCYIADCTVGWYRDGLIGTCMNDDSIGAFIDSTGTTVFDYHGYSSVSAFSEGYAAVKQDVDWGFDGYWGFIDKTGNLVIPCTFEGLATDFCDGLAGVAKGGKYGYINTSGETVIPFEYDAVYGSRDGLAAVVKDGKCGLVNYQNEVVVPLEYDDISEYAGGVAYAVKDGIVYILHITENPTAFVDVPANVYYADPVAWAVEQGITDGTSDSTFSPEAECTRAQVVTFLWRAAGEPEPTTEENPFADLSENSYYYKAVLWAKENGITDGTSADQFSPNDTCSRAQVVTFLYRYAGEPAVSSNSGSFADVSDGNFYTDAVAWAVEQEITDGTSTTTFSPTDTCTRGQVVTFLYRDLADA